MKPDDEDLERDRAGELREQRVPGVDADDARRRRSGPGPRGCCARRSACCRRSAAATAIDDTITPETSRPPALPRPTCEPKAGNWIRPIRKPRIMPTDSVSRSVAVLGRAIRPSMSPTRCDRALQAGDEQHVDALQLRVRAERDRLAAALDAADLDLAGEVRVAELLQRLADELLVGDEDLGLVERDVERLRVGDLRTDQAHVVGESPSAAAERDRRRPSAARGRASAPSELVAAHAR